MAKMTPKKDGRGIDSCPRYCSSKKSTTQKKLSHPKSNADITDIHAILGRSFPEKKWLERNLQQTTPVQHCCGIEWILRNYSNSFHIKPTEQPSGQCDVNVHLPLTKTW